ncbi:hypothetical protein F5141DRAFT_1066629 [Pisolithus sp. B1]|nr:hypothetical protein F5141DRAFT_1066629 [Pisolithus sp. B1]
MTESFCCYPLSQGNPPGIVSSWHNAHLLEGMSDSSEQTHNPQSMVMNSVDFGGGFAVNRRTLALPPNPVGTSATSIVTHPLGVEITSCSLEGYNEREYSRVSCEGKASIFPSDVLAASVVGSIDFQRMHCPPSQVVLAILEDDSGGQCLDHHNLNAQLDHRESFPEGLGNYIKYPQRFEVPVHVYGMIVMYDNPHSGCRFNSRPAPNSGTSFRTPKSSSASCRQGRLA